jgi:outer membrane immunogenic protein
MQPHLVGSIATKAVVSGLAFAVGLSAATAARAQDDAARGWAGWYLGAAIGGYSADVTETESLLSSGQATALYGYTGDGVATELYLGHMWQSDAFLYGVEVGLNSGEEAVLDFGTSNDFYVYEAGLTMSVEVRLGYLVRPDTLVYSSAGVSFGSLDYDWTAGGTRETGSVSSSGYAVGFGVERLLGDSGALRLGIDYTSRDTDDFVTGILPDNSYSSTIGISRVMIGYTYFLGQ